MPIQPARVLIVDNTPSVHDAIRYSLCPERKGELIQAEVELFGASQPPSCDDRASVEFEIDSAFSGQEALTMADEAVRLGRPYGVAFVDVRMPTGWDGVETIRHLWKVDSCLEVVIGTAFSDFSWREIAERLEYSAMIDA